MSLRVSNEAFLCYTKIKAAPSSGQFGGGSEKPCAIISLTLPTEWTRRKIGSHKLKIYLHEYSAQSAHEVVSWEDSSNHLEKKGIFLVSSFSEICCPLHGLKRRKKKQQHTRNSDSCQHLRQLSIISDNYASGNRLSQMFRSSSCWQR